MSLTISKVCQGIAPSVTLGLNAKVQKLRASGVDVIGLGAGEPDFDTPAHIRAAAARAMEEGKTRYTDASGMPALRDALADFLWKDKGLQYARNEIIVSTGAKQAILGALQAILDPGDEVLLPAPCWVSYPEMVRMAGGVPVVVTADERDGFIPPIARLRAAVTQKTKAILFSTPGNPTGAVWSRGQLAALAALAVEKAFYIISDEIYEKLVYDGAEHVSVASLGEDVFKQTIVISGFSKAYAMTGWRLGYASGPRAVIAAMAAYQSHATGNPNSIAQYAGLAALTGDQTCVSEMASAFAQRRELMLSCIARIPGVSCQVPHGAFYVMLDVRGVLGRSFQGRVLETAHDFAEALLACAQVAVVPGESFFAPGFCRLSYAVSSERIMEAMRRIATFVGEVTLAA